MAQWNANTVPACKEKQYSDDVLVTWIPNWNRNIKLVSKAIYIPYHHCDTEGLGLNTDDYCNAEGWDIKDEDEDNYWIPEGWYETVENYIYDVGFVPIDGKVIAWSRLPKPYEPRLKELRGE